MVGRVTEILIDADFGHPPERVWRALTDRAVLSQWFMQTDLEPYEGRRFRLVPDGLLGLAGPLEGELVEVTAPRRLVMLWRGEQLHSRVTWELVPLPDGCRLRMSHTGFIGVKGTLRRNELQRAYDRMLHQRLPHTLNQLAAGKAGGTRGGPPNALPTLGPAVSAESPPASSAGSLSPGESRGRGCRRGRRSHRPWPRRRPPARVVTAAARPVGWPRRRVRGGGRCWPPSVPWWWRCSWSPWPSGSVPDRCCRRWWPGPTSDPSRCPPPPGRPGQGSHRSP